MVDHPFCSLEDIARHVNSRYFSLPTVQRGFVWRPYQIEHLWDSLLRCYPIGSFVLAQNITDKGTPPSYQLLDGQQRATAICLGFQEPFGKREQLALRVGSDAIRIFIDLKKPTQNDNRQYIFRVITRSHPWGYRRRENQKTLRSVDIAKAVQDLRLQGEDYLQQPLDRFWPFDADFVLPFSLFLLSTSLEELKSALDIWIKKINPRQRKRSQDLYTIEEIYAAVQIMREFHRVPLVELPLDKYYHNHVAGNDDTGTDNEMENEDAADSLDSPNVENRDLDEIENLFIRLNAGGTPLRGEELNYSMLKTRIDLSLQEELERQTQRLFNPARFITLAYRLFQHWSNENKAKQASEQDAFTMRVKPAQFRNFQDSHAFADFKSFLKMLLDDFWVQKLEKYLIYDLDNDFGLPIFTASRLAESAPEVMFVLMYRLIIKKDKVRHGSELHRRMLGMITLFAWLGRGGSRRDHSRLLINISNNLIQKNTNDFWSGDSVRKAAIPYHEIPVLPHIPPTKYSNINYLGKKLGTRIDQMPFDSFTQREKEIGEDYSQFIRNMFNNRDLVLYAQRASLHQWFQNNSAAHLLEDTNRPFDYDHICPQKMIYRKWHIREEVKGWYNTNGNIRAWPYSLNRGDGDAPPSQKMAINKDDFAAVCQKIGFSAVYRKNIYYEWSDCSPEDWRAIEELNLTESSDSRKLIRIICKRNLELCNQWYKALLVGELVPDSWPDNNEEG